MWKFNQLEINTWYRVDAGNSWKLNQILIYEY
jgi:hypothetical protein